MMCLYMCVSLLSDVVHLFHLLLVSLADRR